jgi:hypothetical protein
MNIKLKFHLEENSLADRIAIHSAGYSGSHAALSAVTQEPYLFHGATLHVSYVTFIL